MSGMFIYLLSGVGHEQYPSSSSKLILVQIGEYSNDRASECSLCPNGTIGSTPPNSVCSPCQVLISRLVLFCFVLFCFVLFCFVLFCFVLFCFVLFCFVLFCSVRSDKMI